MMFDIEDLEPFIKRVADSVHSSFPAHHSKEDTESALWVWVMENKKTVEKYLDSEGGSNALYLSMAKKATAHLKEEDAAIYGYSQEDVFHYTRSTVETILETVFEYEDWQSFAICLDTMPKAKAQANMTGDSLAMYADVKSAVSRLTDNQYNAILWRYKYHLTYEALGSELGISKQAARDRVERAVSAVQKSLGSRELSEMRSGYESRQSSTTASAVARTERDYEG